VEVLEVVPVVEVGGGAVVVVVFVVVCGGGGGGSGRGAGVVSTSVAAERDTRATREIFMFPMTLSADYKEGLQDESSLFICF